MVPLDPRERWAPLLSQCPDPVKLQQPDISPGLQIFATRLSPQRVVAKQSASLQTALRPNKSTPPGRTGAAAFNERRARHIPIVITPSIIQSVLKDSPLLPEASVNYGHPPHQPRIPKAESDASAGIKSAGRKRHVPIVIPDFAQPEGLFPPTPPSAKVEGHTINPKPLSAPARFQPDMSRPPTSTGRSSTMNSDVSAPSPTNFYAGRFKDSSSTYLADMNSSQSSLNRDIAPDMHQDSEPSKPARTAGLPSQSASASPAAAPPNAANSTPMMGTTQLSGLVCNEYRTTGREPHPLVGATTTILGDKLYVFGGRVLSRTRPRLTSDLYELDLIKRHWSKIETTGDIPPPRYFHSVCSLGEAKLVCYGGMSPSSPSNQPSSTMLPQPGSQDSQPEVVVLSDIHVYDVHTRAWTYIPTVDTPQGRYAHCATILPSSAAFASASAPLSAIHHNPSSSNPNQGSIGVALDGSGGAEMVVVGGQDSANQYIEQISVFNLRSLKWTATNPLGRSCGAYRSVVAPLTGMTASRIGKGPSRESGNSDKQTPFKNSETGSSMLIYSNYNFLDVKLELQVRLSDGTLSEKHMHGQFSPPGLRFPNGGVLDNHFVVSGTYLTSSKQEYALWALDLRTLTWARIDAGGTVFTQGSWNRGVLWNRRNTFVILGNRKRSLVEDYNHRRINFSNICMVELEAFGIYDNPRRTNPTSGYVSVSSPRIPASPQSSKTAWLAGGRPHLTAAEELGQMALGLRELADMDLLAIGGERVPVNSNLIAHRWGPYFIQLLSECAGTNDGEDVATLRGHMRSQTSRNSSITITGSIRTNNSAATTLANSKHDASNLPTDLRNFPATSRPRTLYLPHTYLTLQTLVHYLYTSALPPPSSPLSTPQILCSLLQLARPYQIDGLLEATIERLHQVLDGRNAAAIFNAAAMAAGGGRGIGVGVGVRAVNGSGSLTSSQPPTTSNITTAAEEDDDDDGGDEESTSFATDHVPNTSTNPTLPATTPGSKPHALRINTSFPITASTNGTHHTPALRRDDPNPNFPPPTSASTTTSTGTNSVAGSSFAGTDTDTASVSESGGGYDDLSAREGPKRERERERQGPWTGELSAVVGLQKRGLRGLMEGRRMRERGRSLGPGVLANGNGVGNGGGGGMEGGRVGLGIA